MEIRHICTLVFLLANGWKDWKRHQISLLMTAAFALAGIVFSFLEQRAVQDLLVPGGTGLRFLALSILTGGALGMGDGWILLALGTALHTGEYVRMLCLGMICAAVYAGFLLIVRRKDRKTEIPLVPFLFLGYLGGFLW